MFTELVRVSCSFLACPGSAKYHTFDISPTFPDSRSSPWLWPNGNRLVLSLPVLSESLSVLSYYFQPFFLINYSLTDSMKS